MEQLLSIKHIPIKVEVKVQRAEFRRVDETSAGAPSVKAVQKNDGGVRLEAQPIKINLSDSRNFDAYVPSQSSDGGFTLTYEAVAKLADKGSKAAGAANLPKQSEESRKVALQRVSRSIETVLQSLPKNKNSAVSYSNGTLSISYQMSSAQSAELPDDTPEFEFIPGSIEFIVSQMPEVDIEYLGEPIYFPRSADPNYESLVDVHV